jgi:hypothetical protein
MATLLETIRNNMQQAGAAPKPQATEVDTTGQAQKLLQAKSGKAVSPGTSPRISNVGEQVQTQQAQLARQQVAAQAQQAAQQFQTQAGLQQKQLQQAEQGSQFETQKVETDFLRNEDAVLDQYLRGQKQLNVQKDKAQFEQLGFQLRLTNTQYIDNLKREAAKAQLDNDLKFKEEMARTVFSEEHGMFTDNLEFRSALFADKSQFRDMMAEMDLNYAVQMAEFEAKQASSAALFTGIGGMISGGADLYAAYETKKPKPKPKPNPTPEGEE